MKNTGVILTIGAIAAGVFLLFRSKGAQAATGTLGFHSLPTGSLFYSNNGNAYVTAPLPANAWDLALTGGTINLANSAQVIQPASVLDRLFGLPV